MPREYHTGTLVERVWARVQRGAEDECWPFRGATSDYGHGTVRDGKHLRRAHVVVFEDTFGPLPLDEHGKKLKVLHQCDNPPCCNPAHLFSGTQIDNIRDMIAKGRDRKAIGLSNGRAKLSDADVRKIRNLRAAGFTRREVAARFGVHYNYISGLTSGKDRPYV